MGQPTNKLSIERVRYTAVWRILRIESEYQGLIALSYQQYNGVRLNLPPLTASYRLYFQH